MQVRDLSKGIALHGCLQPHSFVWLTFCALGEQLLMIRWSFQCDLQGSVDRARSVWGIPKGGDEADAGSAISADQVRPFLEAHHSVGSSSCSGLSFSAAGHSQWILTRDTRNEYGGSESHLGWLGLLGLVSRSKTAAAVPRTNIVPKTSARSAGASRASSGRLSAACVVSPLP